MNCKKVKKQISLLAGADLSEKKAANLRAHIAECPFCRQELMELEAALEQVKVLAQKTVAKDWEEGDWKSLMSDVISQKVEPEASPFKFQLKPTWAYGIALMALCGILIALFLFRSHSAKQDEISLAPQKISAGKTEFPPVLPSEKKAPGIEEAPQPLIAKDTPVPLKKQITPPAKIRASKLKSQPAQPAQEKTLVAKAESQEILSMTLVSRQTGLKIIWIFNKNFEWKEDEK